jgi:F0F1-type ATP synthase membrane subunit a
MDASFLSDPVMLSLFGKIVAGTIILLGIIFFIPGLIIGWFVGKSMG